MTFRHNRRRRNRKSGAESIISMLAHLPWFVIVILAASTYFGFDYIEATLNPRKPVYQLLSMLLGYGKYVAVAICFIAAVASFFRGRSRKRLLSKAKRSDNLIHALSQMSWREFELLVGQVFRERGYTVAEGKGSRDGGVDLVLFKDGKTSLVQCKHWKSGNVGVAVVRELFGVMTLRGAHHGFVICSGKFTKDAFVFAKQANVSLVGLAQLERVLSR